MINGYGTYVGVIVALAPTVAGWFGVTLTPAFGEQLGPLVMDAITVGGALFALYRRAIATIPGWLAK